MASNKILVESHSLTDAMRSACKWLVDIAQIKEDHLQDDQNPRGIEHLSWRGAFRGEYNAGNKQWDTFCPIWHSGQGVKALVAAYKILKEDWLLDSARLAAEFVGANRVDNKDSSDYGLIFAYEGTPGELNTSAILETLDGLLALSEITGDMRYQNWAVDAVKWITQHAYRPGEGMFRDFYYPAEQRWYEPKEMIEFPDEYRGRPLIDDAIFLKISKITGDEKFRDIFLEVADKLLSYPVVDSWLRYHPCVWKEGLIHPRQAYWWGEPMIDAFHATQEQKYLDRAIESARWYVKALRSDGGLFRATYVDFKTSSFGHATSGSASAAAFLNRLIREFGMDEFITPMELALNFCMKMQLKQTADPNLKGVILEKINCPNGSDASPYQVRDLGPIFFIQTAASYLSDKI